MRTLGAAPTSNAHLGYAIAGTFGNISTSGGIIASITIPVVGSFLIYFNFHVTNANTINYLLYGATLFGSSYVNFATAGTHEITISGILNVTNTVNTTYNFLYFFNGSPVIAGGNFITATRVG